MDANGAQAARGRVRSVNVGMPVTVPTGAGPVRTGIFKGPVTGPVALRPHGLAGDGQADLRVHGGPDRAAYIYRWEDYLWWMSELGHRLAPGELGENLTVEGLGEVEVRLGDRFRIGEALVESTSPRVPCHKLALRMGDPAFPDRFRRAGRSGFYVRVIEEGAVAAGDPVERTVRRDDLPALEDVAALQHPGARDLAALRRVAAAGPLSASWRSWVATRIARLEAGERTA